MVDDLVPPEISEKTAVDILFVGKAVRALRQKADSLTLDDQQRFLQSFETAMTFNGQLFENCMEKAKEKVISRLPTMRKDSMAKLLFA